MGLGKFLTSTAISIGLPLLVAGCPAPNSPPEVSISEMNGTLIRTTQNPELARQYGWDEAIVLPIHRGDVYAGTENFIVSASDIDGPDSLTANFYALTSPFTTNITHGANELYSTNWNMSLGATGEISRGTYPLAEAVVDDGCHRRTVGILGAFSRGTSEE
jgi:hypothetical protein